MVGLLSKLTAWAPKVLTALLILGALGATIALQRQELIAETTKNASLKQDNTTLNTAIKQLHQTEADNKKRLAHYHTESRRITQTLAEREAYLEQLQHNDEHIQTWADTPLPNAIIRLRHRNATTGAAEYPPLPSD
jgi:LysB family phage lysis regulatory protein